MAVAYDAWMLHPGWVRGEASPDLVPMSAIADHVDHICRLAGNSGQVAVGSDLDGGFAPTRPRANSPPSPISGGWQRSWLTAATPATKSPLCSPTTPSTSSLPTSRRAAWRSRRRCPDAPPPDSADPVNSPRGFRCAVLDRERHLVPTVGCAPAVYQFAFLSSRSWLS